MRVGREDNLLGSFKELDVVLEIESTDQDVDMMLEDRAPIYFIIWLMTWASRTVQSEIKGMEVSPVRL